MTGMAFVGRGAFPICVHIGMDVGHDPWWSVSRRCPMVPKAAGPSGPSAGMDHCKFKARAMC